MSKPSFSLDRRAVLVAGLSTVALAACSSIIGPPDAPPIYVLRPKVAATAAGRRAGWQLSIMLPDAPESLNTTRIALVQPSNEMDYYANANWQDRLPILVQTALVEAFETNTRITAVGRDTDGLKSDYILQADIRDFQARYDTQDGVPTAVVRLSVKLIDPHLRVIKQAMMAKSEVAATQNSVPAVAQAFNQALSEALGQVVDWALNAPVPARA